MPLLGRFSSCSRRRCCTKYTRSARGDSGCHGTNAGGGGQHRRVTKSGAKPRRQPHQRSGAEQQQHGMISGYRTQNVLNIQPVIPVKFSENWNLIIRWITPIIYQPLGPGVGVSGLGDMQPTFLLSPSKPHKLIWGAGPIFQLPTATSQYTGTGEAWHRT